MNKLRDEAETADKAQLWAPSMGKAGYALGLKMAVEIVRALIPPSSEGGEEKTDPIRAAAEIEKLRNVLKLTLTEGISARAAHRINEALSKHRGGG